HKNSYKSRLYELISASLMCSICTQISPTWQCYAGLPPEEGAWPFITCRSAAASFPLPPFQLKNGAPKGRRTTIDYLQYTI
ncbi:hypothetical protein, partial [uncultured Dialister sp.]|uniref:hypothetical protein n=1 Tax=uncultured Dialister sp. TaxID=278064 RepID=UPI0025E23ECF